MVQNSAATRVAGSLKKQIIRDISVSFVIGIPSAFAYWHYFHMGHVRQREAWYRQYAQSKSEDSE